MSLSNFLIVNKKIIIIIIIAIVVGLISILLLISIGFSSHIESDTDTDG